ncbi:YscO family type III secretion system apparatus protein [Pseudomonas asuensis]|uniref:Type III secretion protein n=1 Tax=Pseudomonas asuensis TaxID=1825787 RepID=A0ABQ2H373_9PSED|nr:YscO family type III secretion system apparatus protein [Pseudomonas asuensis]GGM31135.1 type III secretion protein [Pseudomonas asuensis]
MDSELEVDPQRAALEEVISILMPLRQHRQARAERQQRNALGELKSNNERLTETRVALWDERNRQVESRQTLAVEHVNQSLTLGDVDRWHDQERSMLDQLSRLRQGVQHQTLVVKECEQTLQLAQQGARAAQRAVEKLSCLAEAINDEV